MAINIQEILHPSDSDSIKFEKINYNFDQILAHGGGPQGPRGFKGAQGLPGETGQKGQKGDLGPQGFKGDEGTSDSPWYAIDIDLDNDSATTTDTYKILKPKVTGFGYNPIIWLGDDSFIEDSQNGDISTNAKLTIAKGGVFDNYLKLVHTGINTSKLVVTSSDDGVYSEFAIQNDFGSPDVAFKLNVDKIFLEASTSSLDIRGTAINLTALNNSNITFDALGSGIFDVDIDTEFKGYLNLPKGTTSNRPSNPSTGMIYFNTELDITEVYYANSGIGEWRELCTTCGEIQPATIGISGDDIEANADGTPVFTSLSLTGGDYDANADGSEVEDSVTTTYQFDADYTTGGTFVSQFGAVVVGGGGVGAGGGGFSTPTVTPTGYVTLTPTGTVQATPNASLNLPTTNVVGSPLPTDPWSIKSINGINISNLTVTSGIVSLNIDKQPGSIQDFVIVLETDASYVFDNPASVLINSASRLSLVASSETISGNELTFTLRDDSTPTSAGTESTQINVGTQAAVSTTLEVTNGNTWNWTQGENQTRTVYWKITGSGNVGGITPVIQNENASWLSVQGMTASNSSGYGTCDVTISGQPNVGSSEIFVIAHPTEYAATANMTVGVMSLPIPCQEWIITGSSWSSNWITYTDCAGNSQSQLMGFGSSNTMVCALSVSNVSGTGGSYTASGNLCQI